MRAEKINQDQVRFTLTEIDLAQRNIDVAELSYGSEKAKALFEDMMKTALDEFGVDFSEKPLMIEAIPVKGSGLSITVTRVTGAAEAGSLFGANLLSEERPSFGRGDELKKLSGRDKKANGVSLDDAIPMGSEIVFLFSNLEDVRAAAAVIPDYLAESADIKSELYDDPSKDRCFLIVRFETLAGAMRAETEGAEGTRFLVSLLTQFSNEWNYSKNAAVMVREHGKAIYKTDALARLKESQHA